MQTSSEKTITAAVPSLRSTGVSPLKSTCDELEFAARFTTPPALSLLSKRQPDWASMSATAALVVGDFVAQVFVRGIFIALTVAVSIELLDLGEGGVGLLNAAVGLGGLVGALGALGLAGGARLGTVFVVALAGWGLPLLLIGAWPVALIALAAVVTTVAYVASRIGGLSRRRAVLRGAITMSLALIVAAVKISIGH